MRRAVQKSNPEIETKIKHVLEETRVILPGTQILLGFQFAAVFQQTFNKIPPVLKDLHLASLYILSLAIIMLFGIVSFHRIAEEGKDTQRLHVFSHKVLVISLLFVGLGLCIDIFIITILITQNVSIAIIISLLFSIFTLFLWFGYSLFKRNLQ